MFDSKYDRFQDWYFLRLINENVDGSVILHKLLLLVSQDKLQEQKERGPLKAQARLSHLFKITEDLHQILLQIPSTGFFLD